MKLKKILVIFAVLAVVLGLNAVSFSAEYYCAPKGFEGYDSSYLYDTSETVQSCNVWVDFPDLYNKCIRTYKQKKAIYAMGGCVPIAIKNYSFGATKCTVKNLGNKKISTECSGPNASTYTDQLNN